MIHTIHLENECVSSEKQLKETRRQIRYVDGIAPEGYTTSEEFRKLAVKKVNKFCDEHGIL